MFIFKVDITTNKDIVFPLNGYASAIWITFLKGIRLQYPNCCEEIEIIFLKNGMGVSLVK